MKKAYHILEWSLLLAFSVILVVVLYSRFNGNVINLANLMQTHKQAGNTASTAAAAAENKENNNTSETSGSLANTIANMCGSKSSCEFSPSELGLNTFLPSTIFEGENSGYTAIDGNGEVEIAKYAESGDYQIETYNYYCPKSKTTYTLKYTIPITYDPKTNKSSPQWPATVTLDLQSFPSEAELTLNKTDVKQDIKTMDGSYLAKKVSNGTISDIAYKIDKPAEAPISLVNFQVDSDGKILGNMSVKNLINSYPAK